MLQEKRLRQADFVTSIVLFAFGVWVLLQAFQMPMRDTYGGVRNVWYVSPALFPLVVGIGISILSVALLVHSIRVGGAANALQSIRSFAPKLTETGVRFIAILVAISTFVYVLIPRVDFVLSIALFLSFFVHAFSFEDFATLKTSLIIYGAMCLAILVLFWTGFAEATSDYFAVDVIALLATIGINIWFRKKARGRADLVSRFRVGLVVLVVTPLFLAPVFRFLLFVPLPHEGGIVQLMQLVYYSLR